MTVQLVVAREHGVLGDYLERIFEHLEVGLELVLEYSLVLAVHSDDTNILALVWGVDYPVNVAVGHAVVGSILWVLDGIRLEMESVIAEVEPAHVLGLLKFTDFESELGHFFRLVVLPLQSKLLLPLLASLRGIYLTLLLQLSTHVITWLWYWLLTRKVQMIELGPLLCKLVVPIQVRDLLLPHVLLLDFTYN